MAHIKWTPLRWGLRRWESFREMDTKGLKYGILLFLAFALFLSTTAIGNAKGLSEEEALNESRKVTMILVKATNATLKFFLGKEDFLKDIDGCSELAPFIAQIYTEHTGYYARGVSLKYRNPNGNPDQYERGILEEFDRLKEASKMLEGHEDYRVVKEDGKKYLRYMKPLITKKLCLKCHGSTGDIPVVVREFLNTKYPKDRATGFKVGDVRGAVSVKIPLE